MGTAYIVTLSGIIEVQVIKFIEDLQMVGMTEDGQLIIMSRFGQEPSDRVTVLQFGEQPVTHVGNNTNINVFDNREHAEMRYREMVSFIAFMESCKKVKEAHEEENKE